LNDAARAELIVLWHQTINSVHQIADALVELMMALYGDIAVGANVRYHFTDRGGEIVERPGVIVKVWDHVQPGLCNLVVFVDGSNDLDNLAMKAPVYWATSVPYSTGGEHHTWHFAPA
jgi:hypothetical protein